MRHKSTLLSLRISQDLDLAGIVYRTISANAVAGQTSTNKDRSRKNWRWTLQPQIGEANRSPEVVLERAIASACVSGGRTDWANQIPVASGLIPGAADGRRAIDLALRRDDGTIELIELKIASDTPLHATVELLGYACLWLLAKADPPAHQPELLAADRLALRVLAPASYYIRFELRGLERATDASARALGEAHGGRIDFAMDVLDEWLGQPASLSGEELMRRIDRRKPLHV